jgi:CRP/FNR family transcriptional regulator, cyclic AMP receptor protein
MIYLQSWFVALKVERAMRQMEHSAGEPPSGPAIRTWNRFTQAEQAALTEAGFERTWRPGEIIAMQGGPPGSMYVIHRGRVKITATNYRGENATLATRGPAETVGELGATSGLPRTATIQAIDEVHALVIPRDKLRAVLRKWPHIFEELFRTVALRQQQSDRLRLEAGGPDFVHRLAAILLELAAETSADLTNSTRVELRLSQDELASLARVSRSTLIRGLDELRRHAAIQTARQRITLTRPDILRDLAAGGPPPS